MMARTLDRYRASYDLYSRKEKWTIHLHIYGQRYDR